MIVDIIKAVSCPHTYVAFVLVVYLLEKFRLEGNYMAKCSNCGRKGIFLKLLNGLCINCKPLANQKAVFAPNSPIIYYIHNIHPDIRDLLWIADSSMKNNYTDENNNCSINNDFFNFNSYFTEEPSTIFTDLPIEEPENPSNILSPSYFPIYKDLLPTQKWIYLKALQNPYDDNIDIGYIFILYYGLERHLIKGNFEKAFNVILKLRKIHKNSSFQTYSMDALMFSSIISSRHDLYELFAKEYDLNDNFGEVNSFILNKILTSKPIKPEELVTLARRFEFTNTKYIKEYPELFLNTLKSVYEETFKNDSFYPNKFFNKISTPKYKKYIFANMSFSNKEIEMTDYINAFKFKQKGYELLNKTHELVKEELFINRNKYIKETPSIKKPIKLYLDENSYPSITVYNSLKKEENFIDKKNLPLNERLINKHFLYHFAIIELNKDREHPLAIQHLIEICKKNIELVEKHSEFMFMREMPHIEAYNRLCIIYEKQHKYKEAIDICNSAIDLHIPINHDYDYFKNKKERLITKLNKLI